MSATKTFTDDAAQQSVNGGAGGEDTDYKRAQSDASGSGIGGGRAIGGDAATSEYHPQSVRGVVLGMNSANNSQSASTA